MKKMMMMLVLTAFCGWAQAKTVRTQFAVAGKCGMCEQRIEKAAKSVRGVLSANWNQQTKKLTLVYDNTKTTPAKVQQAIAAVGHDAGKAKASAKVYGKLPSCCRYR